MACCVCGTKSKYLSSIMVYFHSDAPDLRAPYTRTFENKDSAENNAMSQGRSETLRYPSRIRTVSRSKIWVRPIEIVRTTIDLLGMPTFKSSGSCTRIRRPRKWRGFNRHDHLVCGNSCQRDRDYGGAAPTATRLSADSLVTCRRLLRLRTTECTRNIRLPFRTKSAAAHG